MIRMEGEGEKIMTANNCGDSDFVVWRKNKSSAFFHWFLLFFIII